MAFMASPNCVAVLPPVSTMNALPVPPPLAIWLVLLTTLQFWLSPLGQSFDPNAPMTYVAIAGVPLAPSVAMFTAPVTLLLHPLGRPSVEKTTMVLCVGCCPAQALA